MRENHTHRVRKPGNAAEETMTDRYQTDRYQIVGPHGLEGTAATFFNAVTVADTVQILHARERDYRPIEIFDRMARHRSPQIWAVSCGVPKLIACRV